METVQPERVALSLRLAQSKPLYMAFKAIREGGQWESLTPAQKRIVEGELRDFELGGVALEGEAKERFNAIQQASLSPACSWAPLASPPASADRPLLLRQELSQLSTKFSNNLLDATKAYCKARHHRAGVAGGRRRFS